MPSSATRASLTTPPVSKNSPPPKPKLLRNTVGANDWKSSSTSSQVWFSWRSVGALDRTPRKTGLSPPARGSESPEAHAAIPSTIAATVAVTRTPVSVRGVRMVL